MKHPIHILLSQPSFSNASSSLCFEDLSLYLMEDFWVVLCQLFGISHGTLFWGEAER